MTPTIKNHQNLLSLWHLYGAVELDPQYNSIWHNTDWPNRCWLEHSNNTNEMLSNSELYPNFLEKLSLLSTETTFSVFHSQEISDASGNEALIGALAEADLQRSFTQMAMHLPLPKWNRLKLDNQLSIKSIADANQFDEWAAIGSDAFGYQINPSKISGASTKKGITCLLVDYKEVPAATALMYKTGRTMGIHQVAVKSNFQGQGIARNLMIELINHCQETGIDNIVLQSSDAGKPLYDSLGFKELYEIHNYANPGIDDIQQKFFKFRA